MKACLIEMHELYSIFRNPFPFLKFYFHPDHSEAFKKVWLNKILKRTEARIPPECTDSGDANLLPLR